jgi:ribosomal protein S18 acetylase RimI-like enzyme
MPVAVGDASHFPGLSFRHIRGEDDAAALCTVRSGCVERDQVDLLSTLEGVPTLEQARAALAGATERGENDQWLLAQVGERVIGYSRFTSWREGDGMWVYLALGWVLPQWRGKGIGTSMLHWMEGRVRRHAAEHHAGEPCEFAANASCTEPEATALLLHKGYYVGYTALEMGLDASVSLASPPELPSGIALRPARPDHCAAIAASIGEAYVHEYAGGRFSDDYDAAAYAADLAQPPNDAALWQVAWDGDEVAGQVLPVVRGGRAEIFEVSVRPAWRRRGLGRALLVRALHDLRARGVSVIRLHTVAEFPTCAWRLYESVGFRVLKRFLRYRKPFGVIGA